MTNWAAIRLEWELSPRYGSRWIAEKYGLDRSEMHRHYVSEGWKKFKERFTQALPEEVVDSIMAKRNDKEPDEINTFPDDVLSVGGKYVPGMHKVAYKIGLLGGTLKDLADAFDVAEGTVVRWCKEHPEFGEAVKRARMLADANIAHSLFKRAMGYQITEMKVVNSQNGPEVFPIEKDVLPDVAAIKFWLTNRQPHLWKDKVEVREEVTFNAANLEKQLEGVYERVTEEIEEKQRAIEGRAARLGFDVEDIEVK